MINRPARVLARRYGLLLGLTALPLLILIVSLAIYQFREQRAELLETLSQSAIEQEVALASLFKAASDHLGNLRDLAEAHLEARMPNATSPLRTHLQLRPDGDRPAGVFLVQPDNFDVVRVGEILGSSALLERDEASSSEIDMVLDLFTPMYSAHRVAPHLRWSYYFSARADLASVFPAPPPEVFRGGDTDFFINRRPDRGLAGLRDLYQGTARAGSFAPTLLDFTV
jgi:hypothetical protein